MFLKDLVDWRSLGLALGLHYPTLEMIAEEQCGNIGRCKIEMLAAWLKQKDSVSQEGVPSWQVLRAALWRIGEKELASRIIVS